MMRGAKKQSAPELGSALKSSECFFEPLYFIKGDKKTTLPCSRLI